MRALLLASLFACAACGEDAPPAPAPRPAAAALGPAETMQRFYGDLAAGDLEAARALMLPLSDADLRSKLEAELSQAAVLFQRGELAATAVEHREGRDWALVVVRHARTQGGATEVRIRDEFLYRTAEGWRLASEPMRADPAVAPLWDADAAELLNWYRASFDDLSARYR